MKRPQFRLSTLLWVTLAVACWFGGIVFEQKLKAMRHPPEPSLQVVPNIWSILYSGPVSSETRKRISRELGLDTAPKQP
jgi:hypothetical protein